MSTKELNMGEIGNLDRQIEILLECKPLSETEVKQLCERVIRSTYFFFYHLLIAFSSG
jgi:hypothetical protein